MSNEFINRFKQSLKRSQFLMFLIISLNFLVDFIGQRDMRVGLYVAFIALWLGIGVADAYVFDKKRSIKSVVYALVGLVFIIVVWVLKLNG